MTSATKILLIGKDSILGVLFQDFLWEHEYFNTQIVPAYAKIELIKQLNPKLIICDIDTKKAPFLTHLTCPVLTIHEDRKQNSSSTTLSFPSQKKEIIRKINSYLSKDLLEEKSKYLLIKQGQTLKKIAIFDILYLESENNQIHINTNDNKIYSINSSLIKMKKLLPESSFMRIHKKYIVQYPLIKNILPGERKICIQDQFLPIGRTFKDDLFSKFQVVS